MIVFDYYVSLHDLCLRYTDKNNKMKVLIIYCSLLFF